MSTFEDKTIWRHFELLSGMDELLHACYQSKTALSHWCGNKKLKHNLLIFNG